MAEIGVKVHKKQVTDSVRIDFTNVGKKALGKKGKTVKISLIFPVDYLPDDLTNKKNDANQLLSAPGGPVSLSGGSGSWRAITHPQAGSAPLENVMQIDLISDNGSDDGALDPDQTVSVTIPLKGQSSPASIDVAYSAKTVQRVNGKLSPEPLASATLTIPIAAAGQPAGTAVPKTPKVIFKPIVDDPLALSPGEAVTLEWEVEKGARRGLLLGPLPFGSHLPLGKNQDHGRSFYRLSKDKITVRVVSSQTYLLEVTYPGKQVVTKMVSLDVFSAEKLGAINLLPPIALPYGRVKANWAAWGVDKAKMAVNLSDDSPGWDRYSLSLNMGADPAFNNGKDTWPFFAPEEGDSKIRLELVADGKPYMEEAFPHLEIQTWVAWPLIFWDEIGFQFPPETAWLNKPPDSLVFFSERLLLCISGRLFMTTSSMASDPVPNPTIFRQVPLVVSNKDMWLDVAVHNGQAVALRKLDSGGDIELVTLTVSGQHLDVNDTTQPLPPAFRTCDSARLASIGDRLYIIPKPQGQYNQVPIPLSIIPGVDDSLMVEPFLLAACHGQLATLDNALYVLRLEKGELVQFYQADNQPEGTLAPPLLAAADHPKPQVENGVLVAVQGVLLILGDKSSEAQIHNEKGDPWQAPQDWVYNPQIDRWSNCGHGLDLAQGTAFYRDGPGTSPRLFVFGGETRGTNKGSSLSVPDLEWHLFADFHLGGKEKSPTRPYLDLELDVDINTPGFESVGIPGSLALTNLKSGVLKMLYPSSSLPGGLLLITKGLGATSVARLTSTFFRIKATADATEVLLSPAVPGAKIVSFDIKPSLVGSNELPHEVTISYQVSPSPGWLANHDVSPADFETVISLRLDTGDLPESEKKKLSAAKIDYEGRGQVTVEMTGEFGVNIEVQNGVGSAGDYRYVYVKNTEI